MDDAGGRRRGLRETPSLELFQALSDHYGINYDKEVVDIGGSSNLNLLVCDADRRYVLRVYRPYVTVGQLADIQLVRGELSTHRVNCSKTLLTLSSPHGSCLMAGWWGLNITLSAMQSWTHGSAYK